MWEWVKEKSLEHRGCKSPTGDIGTFSGSLLFLFYFRENIRKTIPGQMSRALLILRFCPPMTKFHPFRVT